MDKLIEYRRKDIAKEILQNRLGYQMTFINEKDRIYAIPTQILMHFTQMGRLFDGKTFPGVFRVEKTSKGLDIMQAVADDQLSAIVNEYTYKNSIEIVIKSIKDDKKRLATARGFHGHSALEEGNWI